MTRNQNYILMHNMFKDGKISLQEWQEFCMIMLMELMQENKEVFQRLKDR